MDNNEQCAHKKAYGLWHKAAVASLVLLGALLVSEHWDHVISALPYLLLLACPLMHLFMHGKHHHHGDNGQANSQPPKEQHKGGCH